VQCLNICSVRFNGGHVGSAFLSQRCPPVRELIKLIAAFSQLSG
jgi:hypothetical protein